MDFKMEKGVIVRVAEDDKGKKKKGDGVSSAIGLLQELRGFIEKVDACIDAQDVEENRKAIETPAQALDELYKALIKIAESGIRAIREKDERIGSGESMDEAPAPATATSSEQKTPSMPSTPSIPNLGLSGR